MKNVIISIKMLLIFAIITGIIYPLFITLIGQIFFYNKANGSIIYLNNKKIGSDLIAQKFSNNKYFWPRPSFSDYNTIPSGASNLSYTSSMLTENTDKQKNKFNDSADIPPDLIFSSASGIDPHITLEAAIFQINRIYKTRNFTVNQKDKLIKLIINLTENRDFYILGEKRINVLKLNIALDKMDIQNEK